MSKNKKTTNKVEKTDLERKIMKKISSGEVVMKPRWYFVAGSLVGFFSLIGISIGLVYLINIIFFLLRKHGPMGQWRLAEMFNSFPWWIPTFSILGIVVSIWLLKKYDFSYKRNFLFIMIGFVASIIVAGLLIESLGLNEALSRRGSMRRFYHQLELRDGSSLRNQNWIENGQGRPRNLRGQ